MFLLILVKDFIDVLITSFIEFNLNLLVLANTDSSSETDTGIQPLASGLGCWVLIPEGSRRKDKSGKRNNVLRDPESYHYTRHHSHWKCTQTLTGSKRRCNQQVIEIHDQQGNVIDYKYDPRTSHGDHI